MVEELIEFETAKEASIKGFSVKVENSWLHSTDKCLKINKGTSYNRNHSIYKQYSAPTQSLLHKWLREKHNILIAVYSNASGFLCQTMYVDSGTHISYSDERGDNLESGTFSTYELAFEDALLETLNLIP